MNYLIVFCPGRVNLLSHASTDIIPVCLRQGFALFLSPIDQPALCFTWVASTSYWGIRPYHQKGKSVDRELCSNGLVLPPSKVCATLFCACASPYYEILVVATYPPKVHLAYLRQLRQYRKWHLWINCWRCCSESHFIVNFLQTSQILFNKMTVDGK